MFRQLITRNSFLGDASDKIFPNIKCFQYEGDMSLTSTLRALSPSTEYSIYTELFPIGDDSFYTFSSTEHFDKCESALILKAEYESEIKAHVDKLVNNGFRRLEDISIWLNGHGFSNVEILIHESDKISIVITDTLRIDKLHIIQSLIPRILPWDFSISNLSQNQKELLVACSKGKEQYMEAIEKIAEDFDLPKKKTDVLLTGFDSVYKETEINNIREQINSSKERMKQLLNDYGNALFSERRLQERLSGLLLNETTEDLTKEFFLSNDNLELVSVDGGYLEFIVKGYLDD